MKPWNFVKWFFRCCTFTETLDPTFDESFE